MKENNGVKGLDDKTNGFWIECHFIIVKIRVQIDVFI